MEIAIKIISFLFAIFVLVLVHEFCHFWAAKRFGVKIIRFSIGFGKPIFKWKGKDRIEYVIAAIPLGGYVKMLDSSDAKLFRANKNRAFEAQPIKTRFAIISAGIVGNIIFAVFAFWLTLVLGIEVIKPIIATVEPNSPAYYAKLAPGDEIVKIGNQETENWSDILLAMVPHVGENKNVDISVKRGNQLLTFPGALRIDGWQNESYQPEPLKNLGIAPYHPIAPSIIGNIAKKSPAEKYGLGKGDVILAIDGKPVKNWDESVHEIEAKPNKLITIKIKRKAEIITIDAFTGDKFGPGWKKIGFLGISSIKKDWPKDMVRLIKYPLSKALYKAPVQTWKFAKFNFTVLSKLITGKISLRLLGGPIMILQSASQAMQTGFVIYIRFLAILSLALAFTNLLPIPGLDGGYLAFLLYEVIAGKPLSQRSQMLFYRLGIIFLVLILLQATTNDLMRLF